jgi:hypothetical protein
MKGLLVRIGIDQAYGGWNAPVDPRSGRFAYVPIPEGPRVTFHSGLERPFTECLPALEGFSKACDHSVGDLRFPPDLLKRYMHLDPDFEQLTYGDDGSRRGSGILDLVAGDLLVFYAGLRPIHPCEHKLVYGLVGLYVVQEVAKLPDIPKSRWGENAHTRKIKQGQSDVIVRARPGVSGRLDRCIPIGEWRDGAYRVCRGVLTAWGGLSVKDGFIQRSVVPPRFLDADRFYRWFLKQKASLLNRNN